VVAEKVSDAAVLQNGQSHTVGQWKFDALAMYNIKRMRSPGQPYHEKGAGNGYVVTYGGLRIYIAGDTEAIPEMKALKDIDVAFLPMNLPYTMPPEEAAEAAKAFQPKVVYPYHCRGADLSVFEKALAGTGIEVRLRDWYY
jgi:L-ascorbate metabolism protein UlaG (beta-lactamase superfamily)